MRGDCDKVGARVRDTNERRETRGESVGRGTSPPVRVLSKEQSRLSEGKVIKRTRGRRRLNESCRIG